MVRIRRSVTITAFATAASNAIADVAHPVAQAAPPIVSAGSLFQVVAALMLVLGAIAAVAWLLKRLSPSQAGIGGAVRVVSATAVGQRERVVLLEVADTWLVVGVAPGHVSPLHTMPKPATAVPVANIPLAENKFAGWLKQTLERGRNA